MVYNQKWVDYERKREDWRKRALNECFVLVKELPSGIRLYHRERPRNEDIEVGPVVRCPMCGLVMVVSGNDICMCPECGILG